MSMPLPRGLAASPSHAVANRLHSAAIRLLRHARQADAESGLSPERLSLLSVLSYAGPRTVSALAAIEQVSVPAISRALKALERAGLARLERSGSDRRRVLVHATSSGRALMERGRRRRLQRIAPLLQDLPASALATLARAADHLEAVLDSPRTT